MCGRYLRILASSMLVAAKKILAFRSQSLLLFIGFIAQDLLMPIVFYSIYAMKFSYPGWSLEQVLFLYGTYLLVGGISFASFLGALWRVPPKLLNGTFDYILTRGISPLFLSLSGFFLEGSGDILTGLVLILLFWKPGNVAGYLLTIFIAELFILSLVVLLLAIAVKIIKIQSIESIFWYFIQVSEHPLEVYPLLVRSIFVFIFPVALVSWIPAKIFFGLSPRILLVPALITLALFIVSLVAWQKALQSYTSAGG